MLKEIKETDLFYEYYAKWITVYKKGAIRKVTMDKYLMTQKWLVKLIPSLKVYEMNRIAYQQLLNDYAEYHERQTTMDFHHQTLSINKTWDYKGKSGFQPTKNRSSVRKIQIDWQTVIQFSELIKHLPEDKPIFVEGAVYNSTVNNILARHCKECNIPVISIHGLRHTHASLLLFTGVSIASVARRLGHSSMTTTQKTYLHIIQELENKDIDLVMRSLSSLS
mgnify:CR=1 FL=1